MPIRSSSLPDDVRRLATTICNSAAPNARAQLRADPRVPRKTGRMAQQFKIGRARMVGDRAVVEASNPLPEAAYTDEGTRPHLIVPRRARLLRWEGDGGVIFARRVFHPGNTPRRWWQPALETAWGRALAATNVRIRSGG